MAENSESATAAAQSFSALDGYPLQGTLFATARNRNIAQAAVFNCGGGIPASRYRHFAAWFAAQGIPVLTYDYRGIATSRPRDLRALQTTVEDWAEHDVGGAISHLRSLYPSAELIGISHSIGALLFGGASNAQDIRRFVFVSPHTGYVGDYLARYRIPMAMMWHYIMPALTRIVGYFPGKVLRLGEDIPAGVALEWAARRGPQLASERHVAEFGGTRTAMLLERARKLRGDVLVVSFRDDVFATSAAVSRLLTVYPGLAPTRTEHASKDGVAKVGHFAFFRRGAEEPYWSPVYDWVIGRS